MTRVRVSTTLDGTIWEKVKEMMPGPASQILDMALKTLLDSLEAEREVEALDRFPYEADPALSWEGDPAPELPYNGGIPVEILQAAKRRRRKAK